MWCVECGGVDQMEEVEEEPPRNLLRYKMNNNCLNFLNKEHSL